MENLAYLSLGSNVDPQRNLPAAVEALAGYGVVRRVSSIWQSPPAGDPDQDDYLNAAVALETPLTASDLRLALRAIEAEQGRVRSANKNAPRPIDIDILLFNDESFDLAGHQIPSPEIVERPFVAIPLSEIAPDYVHPQTGQKLCAIASRFDPDAQNMRRRDDVPSPWRPPVDEP